MLYDQNLCLKQCMEDIAEEKRPCLLVHVVCKAEVLYEMWTILQVAWNSALFFLQERRQYFLFSK